MTCFYCTRTFRPYERYYVRVRYGRDWPQKRRLACTECRTAGVVDRKHEYLTEWPAVAENAEGPSRC